MEYAKRVAFALMFAINIGLTIGLFYFYTSTGYYSGAAYSGVEIIIIVLSAVAILVTTLGVFIAIMAIWGYQSLHSIAHRIANDVALKKAEEIATRVAVDTMSRLDTNNYGESEGEAGRDYGAAAGKENGNVAK